MDFFNLQLSSFFRSAPIYFVPRRDCLLLCYQIIWHMWNADLTPREGRNSKINSSRAGSLFLALPTLFLASPVLGTSEPARRLFSFESQKVIGFAFAMLHDWLKKFTPIFHPIRSKLPKPIMTLHSHAFSCAFCPLPVITLSFDWFTVLCVFLVIG